MRNRILAIVAVAATAGAAPAGAPADKGGDAKAPALVPAQVLNEIEARMDLKGATSRAEAIRRFQKAYELGEAAEKQHAGATDLHKVRALMLRVAAPLHQVERNDAARQRLMGVCERIIDSGAPADLRLRAAALLARADGTDAGRQKQQAVARQILASDAPVGAKLEARMRLLWEEVLAGRLKGKQAEKDVRALVAEHAKTDVAAKALIYGAVLAKRANLAHLSNEYLDTLVKEHADNEEVRSLLRQAGRDPDTGKPFQADLTRLDGAKLVLPRDLLGKVVVIDFWATWCGPCLAALPKMKQIYAKYHDKGVEVVGISLDPPGEKDKLAAFVKDKGLAWIHTYADKEDDPTARRYGVGSIPSIWVLDKSGNVLSTTAREDLEGTILKALETKPPPAATQPAK